jgi:hypothetical protein
MSMRSSKPVAACRNLLANAIEMTIIVGVVKNRRTISGGGSAQPLQDGTDSPYQLNDHERSKS